MIRRVTFSLILLYIPMYLSISVAVSIWPSAAFGSPSCSAAARSTSPLRTVLPRVKLDKGDDFFEWMDTAGTLFFFSAYLDLETSELSFISRLINNPRAFRSAADGKDLYREMMAHFGPENIDLIQGNWVGGTNFDRYWDEIESGASQREAAYRTWSGRMAKEFGFSKIESIVYKESISQRPPVLVNFIRP